MCTFSRMGIKNFALNGLSICDLITKSPDLTLLDLNSITHDTPLKNKQMLLDRTTQTCRWISSNLHEEFQSNYK